MRLDGRLGVFDFGRIMILILGYVFGSVLLTSIFNFHLDYSLHPFIRCAYIDLVGQRKLMQTSERRYPSGLSTN